MMEHRQANLPAIAPNWSRQERASRYHLYCRAAIRYVLLLLILTGAFANANAAPNNSVRTLLTDRKGSLWLGTANGVFYLPKRDTDPTHRLHLLPNQVVNNLLEDRDGSILVGTRTGLYRIQDGKALTIKGLPDPLILSLTLDSMGYVWTGTAAGGLAYINKESATPLPVNSGLPLLSVQRAVEDSTGNLWLHTSRGVLRVSLQDLHDVIDGRKDQLTSVLLEKADSIPWILSRDGATQSHGATEKLDLSPPTATITGWTLANEDKPAASGSHVDLDAGQPQSIFFFNAGPSHSSAQVEYRYRLTNYDTDWTTTRTGEARYHRLDFGKYNFEVQARNVGEPWKTPIATLSVYQRPHLYQTWYTYPVLLLLAALLAAHLFRRRVQTMKGRIGIVFEERSRIAAECHDTLMAGFAAISWQLEATAKLFRDTDSVNTPVAHSLELARSMVSHCQAEARRIIWDLRGTDEVTNILSQALSSTLAANYIKERVQTKLDVEGNEVPLAPGCVHHLVCIGQEAVSNAMRHGNPTEVSVRLKYESDSLSLTIRDDGHGFQPSSNSASRRGHFGIPVMEERARKLGGTFSLQTTHDAGTEVTVKVAFNAMQQPQDDNQVIGWIGI
jgi:signal transduction histidine kinase